MPQRCIPDEPCGRVGNGVGAIRRVAAIEPAHVLFDIVGDVAFIRPLVALSAEGSVAIQIIEQHELLSQRVMIRRDLGAEHGERRVAVTALQIAQHLIVGAVLFDDVDDVLEQRTLARPHRHRDILGLAVRSARRREVRQPHVGRDLKRVVF